MIRKILLTAGLLMLVPTTWQTITSGIRNDTVFLAGITSGLLVYGWFFERLKKLKWLNALIIMAVVFFTALVVFISIHAVADNATYEEEVAIVLGAGIRGEEVSLTLQHRLDRALAYYRKNPNAMILVTGGQGPREDIPEALAMARYLIAGGVPAERILREEAATSTYENMVYSKKMLDEYFNGDYSTVIITSGFHMYRSETFARREGIIGTRLHAVSPWYRWLGDYARECAAVIKLWLIKR